MTCMVAGMSSIENICKAMMYGDIRKRAARYVGTPEECARLVMESGLKPGGYILEWSTHLIDAPKLRQLLFNSGVHNVLPPDTHCVSLIPDFPPFIPSTIPLALELIFPLLHPGHPFVGTNHDSDNDVRMTRLMVSFLLDRLD